MEKRSIITISGFLGSGKSTAAVRVAERLGVPRYSAGRFMRDMAAERGMSLLELNTVAERDSSIDEEVDRRQKEFIKAHDGFVLDSRIGWFFAPQSFKVFLQLPVDVAAERVFADMQKGKAERSGETGSIPKTLDEVKVWLSERAESERQRYEKYYGIKDYQDPAHFDLVIDTSVNDIPTVEGLIVEAYEKWKTC